LEVEEKALFGTLEGGSQKNAEQNGWLKRGGGRRGGKKHQTRNQEQLDQKPNWKKRGGKERMKRWAPDPSTGKGAEKKPKKGKRKSIDKTAKKKKTHQVWKKHKGKTGPAKVQGSYIEASHSHSSMKKRGNLTY